jgi:hypothetical protein
MNINFSVAFYDSVFTLMHTLTDEKRKYEKLQGNIASGVYEQQSEKMSQGNYNPQSHLF